MPPLIMSKILLLQGLLTCVTLVTAQYGENNPYGQDYPYGENNPYGQDYPYGENNPYGQNYPYGQDPNDRQALEREILSPPDPSLFPDATHGENNQKGYHFSYVAPSGDGYHTRHEMREPNGRVTGSYTINANGQLRRVDYVADENGFRAVVKTNEPGTSNESPASATVQSYYNPINQQPLQRNKRDVDSKDEKSKHNIVRRKSIIIQPPLPPPPPPPPNPPFPPPPPPPPPKLLSASAPPSNFSPSSPPNPPFPPPPPPPPPKLLRASAPPSNFNPSRPPNPPFPPPPPPPPPKLLRASAPPSIQALQGKQLPKTKLQFTQSTKASPTIQTRCGRKTSKPFIPRHSM
ncbi:formin-like protein 3 [Centruroides sculpturatus]|uniref:formin-like protein 3 n=1 Tax=Centruroides sculpturatus TaxID=218467 RepID=UPI000C6E4793|nr:formin-like protein 3 [Centruroides sculpturatus]